MAYAWQWKKKEKNPENRQLAILMAENHVRVDLAIFLPYNLID